MSDAGSERAPHLHLLPAEVIDAARRAHTTQLARAIIERAVEPVRPAQLARFLEDVIEGGQDAGTWRRGGLLFVMWDLGDLATRPVTELLAPLAPKADETWRRLPVDPAWYRGGFEGTGAPAVIRAELTHRSKVGPNTARQHQPRSEPVEDILASTRRWVAMRLARVVESGLTGAAGPEELWALALPELDPEKLTQDARRAAIGLMLERDELPPAEGAVPGFRGPESWFRE